MVRTAPTLPALNRVLASGSYGSKSFPGSQSPDEHGAWAGMWSLSSVAESFRPSSSSIRTLLPQTGNKACDSGCLPRPADLEKGPRLQRPQPRLFFCSRSRAVSSAAHTPVFHRSLLSGLREHPGPRSSLKPEIPTF